MTSVFDVLSEAPLHTEDFGEGTLYLLVCITVGFLILLFICRCPNRCWMGFKRNSISWFYRESTS